LKIRPCVEIAGRQTEAEKGGQAATEKNFSRRPEKNCSGPKSAVEEDPGSEEEIALKKATDDLVASAKLANVRLWTALSKVENTTTLFRESVQNCTPFRF
jgi:hypothetical protein